MTTSAGQLLAALPEKERQFVRKVAECGQPVDAYILVFGVDRKLAADESTRILRKPAIVAALYSETARLIIVGASIARKVIEDLAQNADSEKVRLEASKTLMDRAGYIAPRARDSENGPQKTLNEMTTEELHGLASQLEAAIADRAKPVNGAKVSQLASQDIDSLI